jgi:hypothetical protein
LSSSHEVRCASAADQGSQKEDGTMVIQKRVSVLSGATGDGTLWIMPEIRIGDAACEVVMFFNITSFRLKYVGSSGCVGASLVCGGFALRSFFSTCFSQKPL